MGVDAWSKLSMRDRSQYIKLALENGVSDLNEIRGTFNLYANGGPLEAIENTTKEEKGVEPAHGYDFVNYQQWIADGIPIDSRGHIDDKYKKPNHPSYSGPGGGNWIGKGVFELSDTQMENPNHTLWVLRDNGDGHVIQTYKGGVVLPEITITPQGNYYHNTYDNIKHRFGEGGQTHTVASGEYLGRIASKYGVTIADIVAANPGLNPDKIRAGQVLNLPAATPRKVDFAAYMKSEGANRNRPMNISAMEQLQDSLVARGFNEPQRLAILGTAAQEMDARGAASVGVGGNGYLGLSSKRMPTTLLDDTPKGRGKQIHYILEDLINVYTGIHPQAGNWNDGGAGGPKIVSGQDGSDKFWETSDTRTATQVLNKSYIRPAGGLDSWNNRADVAEGMQKFMKALGGTLLSTGGPLYPFSFEKGNLPPVRY